MTFWADSRPIRRAIRPSSSGNAFQTAAKRRRGSGENESLSSLASRSYCPSEKPMSDSISASVAMPEAAKTATSPRSAAPLGPLSTGGFNKNGKIHRFGIILISCQRRRSCSSTESRWSMRSSGAGGSQARPSPAGASSSKAISRGGVEPLGQFHCGERGAADAAGLFDQFADAAARGRRFAPPFRRSADPAELLLGLPQGPGRLLAEEAAEAPLQIGPAGIAQTPVIAAAIAGDGGGVAVRIIDTRGSLERLENFYGRVLIDVPGGLLIFAGSCGIEPRAEAFFDDFARLRIHTGEDTCRIAGPGGLHRFV